MARVLSFLIRYFSNYYTLHRSDLAARAAPLDPRLLKVLSKFISLKSSKRQGFLVNTFCYQIVQKNRLKILIFTFGWIGHFIFHFRTLYVIEVKKFQVGNVPLFGMYSLKKRIIRFRTNTKLCAVQASLQIRYFKIFLNAAHGLKKKNSNEQNSREISVLAYLILLFSFSYYQCLERQTDQQAKLCTVMKTVQITKN